MAEGTILLPLVLLGVSRDRDRLDTPTAVLLLTVLAILGIAQIVTLILKRQPETAINPAQVRTFNRRLGAWWMMSSMLVFGFLFGQIGTVVLFGLVSFWALREFITMTP